ncbi:DDE-type integrase/transposase/recombinase [Streptomyces sp. NEAU-W12]|uniref:DDE-type integrase/transposase/recombinase n=1 Tax=Streptomyces sp. NEAU-W12 TaxID=2994668 RepID=UPI003A4C7D82
MTASVVDLVERHFTRHARYQSWITDITEHPTWKSKVHCAAGLDTFSRRVVGCSIDDPPTATLTANASTMAIGNRTPQPSDTVVHSDHGARFGSWASTSVRGPPADCLDGLPRGLRGQRDEESFWARTRVELLDRRRWRTRMRLSTALFAYARDLPQPAAQALRAGHAQHGGGRTPHAVGSVEPSDPAPPDSGRSPALC